MTEKKSQKSVIFQQKDHQPQKLQSFFFKSYVLFILKYTRIGNKVANFYSKLSPSRG